jgi:hypothetical protein
MNATEYLPWLLLRRIRAIETQQPRCKPHQHPLKLGDAKWRTLKANLWFYGLLAHPVRCQELPISRGTYPCADGHV